MRYSRTSLGVLVIVTQQELEGFLAGKYDLLIRKTFPKEFIHTAKALPLYLVLKGTTQVSASAECDFIMHTIGIESELRRAGITEEEFEKRFMKTYKFPEGDYQHADAIAWSVRNVKPLNLQISDFTAIDPRSNRLFTVKKMTRSFTYVLTK